MAKWLKRWSAVQVLATLATGIFFLFRVHSALTEKLEKGYHCAQH